MKRVYKTKLDTLMLGVGIFSDKTFGKERKYQAPLHHLKEEVDEAIDSGDLEEFADMLMLFLDAYRKRFRAKSTDMVIHEAFEKLKINNSVERVWGEPDVNGVVRHINSKEFQHFAEKIDDLSQEWTKFLEVQPEQFGYTIEHGNKIFNHKFQKWCLKMSRKYNIKKQYIVKHFEL